MRLAAVALAAALAFPGAAFAAAETEPAPLPSIPWSFSGPLGTFDRASEQRGLQVWQGVCSNCHSMKEAYYRNLTGIGLTDEQVKAFAAGIEVPGPPTDSGGRDDPAGAAVGPFPVAVRQRRGGAGCQ